MKQAMWAVSGSLELESIVTWNARQVDQDLSNIIEQVRAEESVDQDASSRILAALSEQNPNAKHALAVLCEVITERTSPVAIAEFYKFLED